MRRARHANVMTARVMRGVTWRTGSARDATRTRTRAVGRARAGGRICVSDAIMKIE